MVIEVSDTGTPKRSANTTLEIIITDINDNNPIFQNPPPVGVMVYIPEVHTHTHTHTHTYTHTHTHTHYI